MKRLFWMGVGGAAAVTAARRARKTLQPVAAVAGPAIGWLGALRTMRQEFRTAMTEHEAELKAAFIDEIASDDNPAPDPRRPAPRSGASRFADAPDTADDGDEPYSF